MKEFVKKDSLSKEEALQLDDYYSEHIKEVLEFDNDIIIRLIKNINNSLGYSFLDHNLYFELDMDAVDAKISFNENLLNDYLRKYQLMKELDFDYTTFSMALGDYYFNIDKEQSKKYYSEVFKEGFDLTLNNYFYQLKRYLELLNDNDTDFLERLIKQSPNKLKPSLDQIDTYLTLIAHLDKYNENYLKYINEALYPARILVREYQEATKDRNYFSDTDEERNLCELVALKMEYYVNKKDYIQSYELYKELTDEIRRSDCTRYYHTRNKFYKQMLMDMKSDYPELVFFENTAYREYEIVEDVNKIEKYLNKTITLKNCDDQMFVFKVVNVYENEITIVPILPLLGEGGSMFMNFYKVNNKAYMKNILLD